MVVPGTRDLFQPVPQKGDCHLIPYPYLLALIHGIVSKDWWFSDLGILCESFPPSHQ